jgi:uncharacterized membrane protein
VVGSEEVEEEVSAAVVEASGEEGQAAAGNAKMNAQHFLKQLDDTEIVRAIKDAESKTSGEIRVFITDRPIGSDDVVARAASRFEKLGMTATRDRNAVLLYFAPRSHQFAIVGDKGVHEKLGDTLWQEVASMIREKLRDGRFTEAVVVGIKIAGDALARHFPRRFDDRDELPNEVERD